MMMKHEGDALEVSSNTSPSASSPSLPLVNEIDLSAIEGIVVGERQLEVICNATGRTIRVDPCGDAVGEDRPQRRQHDETSEGGSSSDCGTTTTLTSLVQAAITTLTMPPMSSPPLVAGDRVRDYTISETIVQGWLYKKGTGEDFSGRRWWKPRWVTLAVRFGCSVAVMGLGGLHVISLFL
jgi:hypothetical protein